MTTLTDTQVVTASGGLVELGYSAITTPGTVTSTTAGTGTQIISPLTVVCDGSPILVEFRAPATTAPPSGTVNISLYQDGTENIRQWGQQSSETFAQQKVPTFIQTRLTPSAGVHTFGVYGYNSSGTSVIQAGSGGSTTAAPASLRISKIVQATQWPAVTTGTIICTSSTRPASPFAGQQIYETDTSREFTYVGTQWVPRDGIFTTEALRDAAITSPFEGQRAYITASTVASATGEFTAVPTGIQTIYNGSSWVSITPVGSRTSGTGTTTSATYTASLSGSPGTNPTVTLTTGTTALVSIATHMANSAAGQSCMSFAVSGATTVAASDTWDVESVSSGYSTVCRTFIFTALTAGTNTFTLQYRAGASTNQVAHRCLTVQGIA
jgi:hypothetical protein